MTDTDTIAHDLGRAIDPQYLRGTVTVAQLRDALDHIPDGAIVILAQDAEGTTFVPLTMADDVEVGEELLYYPQVGGTTSPDAAPVEGSALWALALYPKT